MTLPRILVIDDQYATDAFQRGDLCSKCGLIDVAKSERDQEKLVESEMVIADAVFTSGQVRHGASVENSIEEVLKAVESGWPSADGWRWALILLDLEFKSTPPQDDDKRFGLKILEELVRRWPDREAQAGNSELPIVMLSTIPRADRARDANKAGALAYIEKEDLKKQPTLFKELLDEHGLTSDPRGELIGRSHALLKVLREARRIARMRSGNAMILGPQGAGKSSLARYIHQLSSRSQELIIEYYSTPSAENLEYANLFGYWEGAYTDAKESGCGMAEKAHKGILFIDEVHNLTKKTQDELLRFARPESDGQRKFKRLGTYPSSSYKASHANKSVRGKLNPQTSEIAVDVLLLSASNQPLDDPDWRKDKGFDESLYTRLATEYMGNPLHYPSLEQRKEDIPILFKHFLEQETKNIRGRTNENGTKSVDAEVEGQLKEYHWPGNVAELQGVAMVVARNSKDFSDVFARHLPTFHVPTKHKPAPASEKLPSAQPVNSLDEAERILRNVQVPRSLSELEGRLESLQKAYGQLVKQVLEVAFEQQKIAVHSEKYITPAIRTLFPSERMSPSVALSKLLSLAKLFTKDTPPEEGSLLADAIKRAKDIRSRSGVNKGEEDENDA